MSQDSVIRRSEQVVTLWAVTQRVSAPGPRGDWDAEGVIEQAARVCYQSHTIGGRSIFLKSLMDRGHLSVVEHASATFEVSGISRACSHQLVRHRIASYSQESQRYVDMSIPEFVSPESIEADPVAMATYGRFLIKAKEAYGELVRRAGVKREDARFVLPNATATRIVVTMNFRELLHFFELRISEHAQWEIRSVAVKMLELIIPWAPTIFGGFRDDMKEQHPRFFEGET